MRDIDINDYDYDLPSERIAQYPVKERDLSQLLIYRSGKITKDIFRNIIDYIPSDSLLVFNNTRVMRARIIFLKETGAVIEIFCLEPTNPGEYELSFSSKEPVEWKCIIGNQKKWKSGNLVKSFGYMGSEFILNAEKIKTEGEACRIRFSWNSSEISFGEVIDASGLIPLPPYINRKEEDDDYMRYQTFYSSVKGSVAAPTAGLHFTEKVLENIAKKSIKSIEVTLHIGAGTFKPIKSEKISEHEMHCEHFFVTEKTIELLLENHGRIVAVGTTSVRTLESLYWLGVKLLHNPELNHSDISLDQWEVYNIVEQISVYDSMQSLLRYLRSRNMYCLEASTKIMIMPGYDFRMITGIITNFHQPRSTLLLLISAWLGYNWKKTYNFALENDFRFLSYGDSSLLIR